MNKLPTTQYKEGNTKGNTKEAPKHKGSMVPNMNIRRSDYS